MSKKEFHKVLQRQIRKTIGQGALEDPKIRAFVDMVDDYYHNADEDRQLLERTMELNSKELTESYEDLRKQSQELKKAFDILQSSHGQAKGSENLASLAIALKFKNKELNTRALELKKANEELRDTQSKLIYTEKMAVLGQLIAGVMHEVNNPMGVIKGGTQNLEYVLNEVVESMEFLQEGTYTSKQNELFQELIQIFQNKKFRYLSSREERQYRKELEAELHEIGISETRYLAREMVSVDLLKEDVHELLKKEDYREFAKEVLQFGVGFGKLYSNVSNMSVAIGKMQKIIFALRNYTYSNDSETPVKFDLVENLETVLTLYHNKIKRGIQVERNYSVETLELLGFPDEINQVWTNLVQNAIHAMTGEGTLVLDVSETEEEAIVMVTDSGSGITEEVMRKIFEPFFTTKIKGEGTGLGLSICKKIIERHGGSMHCESKPGRTCFSVKLPKNISAEELMAKETVLN